MIVKIELNPSHRLFGTQFIRFDLPGIRLNKVVHIVFSAVDQCKHYPWKCSSMHLLTKSLKAGPIVPFPSWGTKKIKKKASVILDLNLEYFIFMPRSYTQKLATKLIVV